MYRTHQGEEGPGGYGIRFPAVKEFYLGREDVERTLRILINEKSELGAARLTAAVDSLDQRDCSRDLVPNNLVIITSQKWILPSCCFLVRRYSIQTAI